MAQTQFGFQSGINQGMGTGTNQFGNFTTKQPSVSNTKTTTNSKFPGLDQKYIDEIEERTKNIPDYATKMQIQESMYNDFYSKQQEEEKQAQRTEYKNQKRSDAINQTDKTAKQMDNVAVRSADLADLIRKKYNISLSAGTDDEVIQLFVSQIDNGEQLMTDYLNGKNTRLLTRTGLVGKEETFGQKVEDYVVGTFQSPGKRGYNLIGQWIDKASKRMADKLEGSKLQEWLYNAAVDVFGEDEVKAYQEEVQRDIDNGTIFNGREQTDIRTPLLGEERANSKATRLGETVGDITSAAALTAPMSMAVAPMYATATPLGAGILGAGEGAIGTLAGSLGTSGKLPTNKEALTGIGLGILGGQLSRYLAQPKVNLEDNVRKEAEDYIQKSIKPTVKGKQNTTDFNKFIDDTIDSVDAMVKHKDILQYTDDAGNVVKGELPHNMRELSEAIDSMKRYVYQEYDDIAKQAGDAGAKVNLQKAIDTLNELKNNKAITASNPGITNTIDTYIDELSRIGTMDINEAQQLTQNLNNQLKAFFKNPNLNDVSKNAVIAKYNEGIKRAINDSIDDVLGDAINGGSSASNEYTALKQLYGKLLSIEDEVSKRALVMARNNNKGLSQTMVDSLAGGDLAEALLTLDLGKAAKGTVMKVVSDIYRNLNSPDRYLNKLFGLFDTASTAGTTLPNVGVAGANIMEAVEAQK